MRSNQNMNRAASAVCALLALSAGSVGAKETITFAGTGGMMQQAALDTMVKPAAAKFDVEVRQQTLDNIASIRIQVQTGNPAWDIVKIPAEDCAAGSKEGLFEKLDYSKIKTDGIPAQARDPYWIGANMVSTMLAWRTDKFKTNPPRNWADFWDVKRYPGRRALMGAPQETLEIALLADGVQPDKLYPIDVERAFKSLEKIKPHINVWWKTGNQGGQLLKDGEVDMIAIWGSRMASVLKEGGNAAFTYKQGLLSYSCFAIPKGAAHAASAQKMIAAMVSPELQANIPGAMGNYGPVNAKAYQVKAFDAALLNNANSSPENIKQQVLMSPKWWGGNMVGVHERFNAWLRQ
nr:ABC transporter substrate-binding protein [uncultured Pseudogulbenkiania sp.]